MTMEENLNEEEVLLVADKDDGGKLKAVDKSAAKEGIWRMLLPSMENLDDFMKVNKQSSILEDFFHNFSRQFRQPTDFRFYHIPVSLLDTLDVFTDMLRQPEDNKDFILQYEINPDNYRKQQEQQDMQPEAAQQTSPEVAATEQPTVAGQPSQPSGFESRIGFRSWNTV